MSGTSSPSSSSRPGHAPATTQYDQIGQSYEAMKRVPSSVLERNNLRDAIVPYLTLPADGEGGDGEGVSVLDLACGTGFYSRHLLEWASPAPLRRVVGVDISATMVAAAERSSSNLEAFRTGRLKFAVGDATKPLPPEAIFSDADGPSSNPSSSPSSGGAFDVVLGAWLLNYAPSTEGMTRMFANISSALRPGGHFVGITPHPATNLDDFAGLHSTPAVQAEMLHRFGVAVAYLPPPLASGEGYNTRVTANVQPEDTISFDNFHLRREVYEDAARRGGMRGELKWVGVKFPKTDEESRAEYGVGIDYWDGCEKRPHFGILVVEK